MGNPQVSSGGSLLQRDGVSEAFELGDEAFGLLVGVDAGVVVAAGFAVDLMGNPQVFKRRLVVAA